MDCHGRSSVAPLRNHMQKTILPVLFFLIFPAFSQAETGQSTLHTGQNTLKNTSTPDKKLYQLDFSQQHLIPQGWRIPGNNPGQIYVENGVLQIDGRKNAFIPTSILLPQALEAHKNFRLDFEFSLDRPINASRWGGVIYDVSTQQGVIPTRYYQYTFRANTAAKNGTEFGRRHDNGQWEVMQSRPFTENIQAGKWYKASVVVTDSRVQHSLNGRVMQDVEFQRLSSQGAVGLSAAGTILKVKNIQLFEANTTLPSLGNKAIAVQQQANQVAMAPTLIQIMNRDVKAGQEAHQLYYQLNADMNLINQSGQSVAPLAQHLSTAQAKQLLVLEVNDAHTVQALQALSNTVDLTDITFLSKHEAVLKMLHQRMPTLRTALDLSQENLTGNPATLSQIIRRSQQAYARIVVLPQQLAQKSQLSFIQRHLMTVWVKSTATQIQDIAQVLMSGPNGILTTQSTQLNTLLAQFPAHTLLRKPFIIGHRGVPGLEDENTLESAIRAEALGADIVENDVYLSKDQQVVVMHDATVDRTTTSSGKLEQMNLAQIQQLKTKNKGYKIPTLAAYFQAFKHRPDFVLMVEMKSTHPALVAKIREEIQKYHVENQVVMTSFNLDQLYRAQTQLAEIPRGLLVGQMPKSTDPLVKIKQINADVQRFNSSYNPPDRADLATLAEYSRHRGVSFWPWALSDERFKTMYLAGIQGITTNNVQLYSRYVVDVQAPAQIGIQQGQAVQLTAQLTRQDRSKFNQQMTNFMVLPTSPKHVLKNGQLTFLEKGTAYVLASYEYKMDAQHSYHLFSAPVKVVVQ